MPLMESLGLLVVALAAWLWADSLKAREAAVKAARVACEQEGLLLLDDTVAIASIWPVRDDYGRLRPKRSYVFEYTGTGNDRCKGSMTLIGAKLVIINLGLE